MTARTLHGPQSGSRWLPMRLSARLAASAVGLLALAGCSGHLPGKPAEGPEVPRPEAIRDFTTLYRANCSGCHGAEGQHGPAIDLANPVYQALVDDATLGNVIANGLPGTEMPAFGQHAGGFLDDAQVASLVSGLRSNWRQPLPGGAIPPAYTPSGEGNAGHGEQVYTAYCAHCHGTGTTKGPKASSILDPAFLALLSDHALRTLIISGRPDLGMPDWRHRKDDPATPDKDAPGAPLSEQDVTDVVAWIATHRTATPGQPYPQPRPATGEVR